MGATTFYALPYPDPTSPVDVPKDIKALADKLELWKNGLTLPSGNLVMGQAGVAAGRQVLGYRRTLSNTADSTYGMYLDASGNLCFELFKDGTLIQQLALLSTGANLQVASGGVGRPVPFAMQVTTCSVVANAAITGNGTFTLQNGRFTQVPAVLVTPTGGGSSYQMLSTNSLSVSGGTVTMRYWENTAQTNTVQVHVWAVQMLPGSSSGLVASEQAEDSEHIPVTATCHVDGCGNQDIGMNVSQISLEDPVTCGPCGNLITDVARR